MFPPPVPTPDDFIKRVIGRPGDTLRIQGGTVYINGVALREPYVAEKPAYDLQIRDYGIYVSYGDGWQRLDPSVGQRSARIAVDRTRSHPAALLHHVRRQSQRFGRFAHLGLRARRRPLRDRTAHRATPAALPGVRS